MHTLAQDSTPKERGMPIKKFDLYIFYPYNYKGHIFAQDISRCHL